MEWIKTIGSKKLMKINAHLLKALLFHKEMKFIMLTICFGICIFQFSGCTTEKKISDHFDGKNYYNPTLTRQFSPGFLDIFQMIKEGREKWPIYVENKGVPEINKEPDSDNIYLTFVNHATFLIQLPCMNILTDPVWSEKAGPLSCISPKRVRKPGVNIEDLPKIDLIVISHNHYDHLDIETLKKLNELFAPKVIVPVGDKSLVDSVGIKDVHELDWWESIDLKSDTSITFTPSQHSSRRGIFDKDKSLWGSFYIKFGKQSIYFGGDGGYCYHFSEIKKRLGSPDIALLGIGAYLPHWFMKTIHMSPAEAVEAHKDLGAKQSIGMHFGTFQLSSEGFGQPEIDLQRALKEKDVREDRFIILKEGETRIYPINSTGDTNE